HGDDQVEAAPVGEPLALVQLDAVELGAALAEDVLEDAGRLARDVLKDERLHRAACSALPAAIARRSRARSSVSSSTPCSGATSRRVRPEAAASLTIAVARS